MSEIVIIVAWIVISTLVLRAASRWSRSRRKPEPFYDSNYEDFNAEYRYGISHSHKEE